MAKNNQSQLNLRITNCTDCASLKAVIITIVSILSFFLEILTHTNETIHQICT